MKNKNTKQLVQEVEMLRMLTRLLEAIEDDDDDCEDCCDKGPSQEEYIEKIIAKRAELKATREKYNNLVDEYDKMLDEYFSEYPDGVLELSRKIIEGEEE